MEIQNAAKELVTKMKLDLAEQETGKRKARNAVKK